MPRKQAFSGKKKKEQLMAKRQQKEPFNPASQPGHGHGSHSREDDSGLSFVTRVGPELGGGDAGNTSSFKFFESRPAATRGEPGRYALMFRPESKAEVEYRKEEARKTIYPVSPEYLDCQIEDFFTPELDFPTRPQWSRSLSKLDLENRENKYFADYLKAIDDTFHKAELSYFELNLETWRQFWRVLEMSDILLCIVDVRFPPLLFPPKLYEYSCKGLGKHIILVLNKIDLAPAPLVLAWKVYFKTKYPELDVLCFTSYPSYNLHGNANEKSLKGRKRRGKLRMAAEGALELYKVCEKYVADQVDLNTWRDKIQEEMSADEHEEDESELKVETVDTSKPDTGYYEFKKFGDGILTIGCLGQPNVGKSSLINALMGKKVVSVSKTPGHTKHFQTIFLTANVRLCDCPGLIFPSKVPKALQVLCGSYPIAQLREPYSTVKYLAERLRLPELLHMSHPEGDEEWSAFDIADGWAQKRGFYTAKAARLDSYRGANHLLRLALEGRICLCLRPPGFTANEEKWSTDPRVPEIEYIQAKTKAEDPVGPSHLSKRVADDDDFSESSEEEFHEVKVKSMVGGTKGLGKTEESEESGSEVEDRPGPVASVPVKMKTKVQNKFALLLEDEDDSD